MVEVTTEGGEVVARGETSCMGVTPGAGGDGEGKGLGREVEGASAS